MCASDVHVNMALGLSACVYALSSGRLVFVSVRRRSDAHRTDQLLHVVTVLWRLC